jgi:hypothetical protein
MPAPARQLDLLKGPRQRGIRPPPALERATQIALADTLDKYGGLAPGWEWFAIPNGELRTDKTGALLKRMGAKAGVLDMEFLSPVGKPYFLELKRGKAPLKEEQLAFLDRQYKRGVTCAVARSYKEAIDILKGWGAVRATVSV